jgi:hypothetical protein
MSEMKHTLTPWYATGPHVQSAILNEDNYVCQADGDSEIQAIANAEFIVRAVNAHDELLGIAKELCAWEQDPDKYGGDLADLACRARAAIAKAEVKR